MSEPKTTPEPLEGPCSDCGETETVSVDRAIDGGDVSEADYHCARCLRHRAFFAYGHWLDGTGEQPADKDRGTLLEQLRALQDREQWRVAVNEQAVRLREATGQPLMVCKKAVIQAEGDFEKARDIALRPQVGVLY